MDRLKSAAVACAFTGATAAAFGATAPVVALVAGGAALSVLIVDESKQSKIERLCRESLGLRPISEWANRNLERQTLENYTCEMRKEGCESIYTVYLAVDMTRSNRENGVKSFRGRNMHDLDTNIDNPYQIVMRAAVECLGKLNASGTTHLLKFGCQETRNVSSKLVGKYSTIASLMDGYSRMVRTSSMASPTSLWFRERRKSALW